MADDLQHQMASAAPATGDAEKPSPIPQDELDRITDDLIQELKKVYDPEIPVNIYELGLIYKIVITDQPDQTSDVAVEMTLTSPACPVAQEMPGMVQGAIFPLSGVGNVDVEIVWEPTWDPSQMAETAKLQLNMFM